MELNENADIDTSQVDDVRGSGGGGGGGGLGGLAGMIPGGPLVKIIVAVVLALAGGGTALSQLGGDDPGTGTADSATNNSALAEKCDKPDKLQQLDCRNAAYVQSIQDYWVDALPQSFGEQYKPSKTTYFSNAVSTGCGNADSGVGPFYCPADDRVYIDLTFYEVLANELGAKGEFAQPYVLAHEYGHHVQDLLGTEAAMRRSQQRDPGNANKLSVALELQADCFAGAWAKNATGTDTAGGVKIFKSITATDIQEGLDTAATIGDDTLQKRAGGRVNQDAFTHGSSADRQKWFNQGHQTGDPKQCDTFAAAGLN
jgi:predicted metalloprotease